MYVDACVQSFRNSSFETGVKTRCHFLNRQLTDFFSVLVFVAGDRVSYLFLGHSFKKDTTIKNRVVLIMDFISFHLKNSLDWSRSASFG